jgi:hypothetical protein
MNATTQRGFLMLADITGFTPFVASTELEHSNEIVQSILKNIVSFLTPSFKLAEVEGDAVFVYSPSDRFSRREQVLEIIEASYFAFRDMKTTFGRMRTCECKACQLAHLLDLKFVVHYGEYVINEIGGKAKPLGNSVNTVHRLLKNSVSAATGWNAYILFTKECIEVLGLSFQRLQRQTEQYDHLGIIETYSIDLDELYKNSLSERNVYLSKEDADIVVERDFPVPPVVLWEWLNNPYKRTQWSEESDWNIGERPMNRITRGATNHCVNSKVIERILDYRPYSYYTSTMGRGIVNATLTSDLKETPQGSKLSWHIKLHGSLPKAIRKLICKLLLEKGIKIQQSFDKLDQLVRTQPL